MCAIFSEIWIHKITFCFTNYLHNVTQIRCWHSWGTKFLACSKGASVWAWFKAPSASHTKKPHFHSTGKGLGAPFESLLRQRAAVLVQASAFVMKTLPPETGVNLFQAES